nr:hypothetical protein [Tanacetum cinerariifolium]
MSSPNHPTFDIEDAFSFNFLDYFPATPGNTSPNSSNDLTKYLLATLLFSPLHDDPYIEVMQAYDATNELPILPLQPPIASPTVMPLTYNKIGHLTKNGKIKGPATRINLQPLPVVSHACGKKGHYNYQCSKANNSLQDPQNTNDDDDAFDVKENENDVHVSTNGSDKSNSKKHDEKAKRDAKGKSPVGSPTGVRDLRGKFEEFFLTALTSPSNTAVSPNFEIARKSSFVDPSKYLDDPDTPELEDIVY